MQYSDVYCGITQVKIGRGDAALFWKDLWHDQLLMESHPRAFSFTQLPDASIADFLGIAALQEGFHLPLSPQARLEVQNLQELSAPLELGCANQDV